MSHLEQNLGNILLKIRDKWQGDLYLTESLTFSAQRAQAASFYLLKSGDSTILNGDRISLNVGSRTLVVSNGMVRMIDRDQLQREVRTFIISNGSDSTEPIT